MGANVKVVLQYFTDQYAYGTKILGTDTLLVSSAQAFCLLRVAWGHCPCHFCPQGMVNTWHCPWGGRLPCSFLSTQPGQADRSPVLLRAGDRKQDHRKWKEMGIAALRAPFCCSFSSQCLSPNYEQITGAATCQNPTYCLTTELQLVEL